MVADYARTITEHVEMIAHSCGVAEPRKLKRKHVRIVQEDGRSVALSDLNFVSETLTRQPATPQDPA